MRLNNKNIVVTAAAQGIGRATAIAYSKEGANVVATDINEEKLNELKAENSNITTEVLDSTNKEAVENFSQSIKDVDVLFHAVGFVHHGTIMECSSDEFYNSININVYSAYLMSSFLLLVFHRIISPFLIRGYKSLFKDSTRLKPIESG